MTESIKDLKEAKRRVIIKHSLRKAGYIITANLKYDLEGLQKLADKYNLEIRGVN